MTDLTVEDFALAFIAERQAEFVDFVNGHTDPQRVAEAEREARASEQRAQAEAERTQALHEAEGAAERRDPVAWLAAKRRVEGTRDHPRFRNPRWLD